MSPAKRVVLDTNVVVSAALLHGSKPYQALLRVRREGTLLLSEPLLLEISDATGDPDLLLLGSCRDIPILSCEEFLSA